jgi:hypothetical protein
MSKDQTPPDHFTRMIAATVVAGLAFLFAITYFLAGLWYYHKGQKLTASVIALHLFDGGRFKMAVKHTGRSLYYTTHYLEGTISGYPVEVYLDGSYGAKYTHSIFRFNFCIMKFKHPHYESLEFLLDWKGNLKADLRSNVAQFVRGLKDKGYCPCIETL